MLIQSFLTTRSMLRPLFYPILVKPLLKIPTDSMKKPQITLVTSLTLSFHLFLTESLPPKPYRNNAPPNNFCCFYSRNTNWKQMPDRRIHPLVQDTSLPNNSIQTSKYTWLTFIPINLWEQFSQLANIYFLVSSSRIKNLSTL